MNNSYDTNSLTLLTSCVIFRSCNIWLAKKQLHVRVCNQLRFKLQIHSAIWQLTVQAYFACQRKCTINIVRLTSIFDTEDQTEYSRRALRRRKRLCKRRRTIFWYLKHRWRGYCKNGKYINKVSVSREKLAFHSDVKKKKKKKRSYFSGESTNRENPGEHAGERTCVQSNAK